MNTADLGKKAEKLVADSLKAQKHKILSMNWKNRWCEIDVISKKNKTVYFTEVKFRSSDLWGDGLSYLTSKKVKQMKFAAEIWLSQQNWNGECILQGASVDASDNIQIIEIL